MDQSIKFDIDLIQRYDKSGPRYTSYPTALELHPDFTEQDYRRQIDQSNQMGGPLSLYIHIPFCDTVCFYCACNKIITKNRQHAEPYVKHLVQEIERQGQLFDNSRVINQLHWGGGTPTFLTPQQMQTVMTAICQSFEVRDDDQGEYSIEIDPRETNEQTIDLLRTLGFNRISLGVQDFDSAVQQAVNRIQSETETFTVLEAAKRSGFRSINIDLIYGLPLQTLESFRTTLNKVLAFDPDRFSIFNYAHLPSRFKTQRQIVDRQIPSATEKLAILQMTGDILTAAGYVYIGMDHFAKPDDELSIAQREGLLYRNFQGYSTHSDCDLVGLGMTSIGLVGDAYVQNIKTLDDYNALLNQGKLAIFKGLELSEDDKIRRAVITELICHFELYFDKIERQFKLDFNQYFAVELNELKLMQTDGLLTMSCRCIKVQPVGRLLVRNICMVFDHYLAKKQQQFSRVI